MLFRSTVFGVANVMLVQPPALPNLVPLIVPAAPAIVISCQSTSLAPAANAAVVIVLGVPKVSLWKNNLHLASVPAPIVNVPLTVIFDLNTIVPALTVVPVEVCPAKDRLLNVGVSVAPEHKLTLIPDVPMLVAVKETLYHVFAPNATI